MFKSISIYESIQNFGRLLFLIWTKESDECSSFVNQYINNLCNRGYNNNILQKYDLYGENSFAKEVNI
jgi:hypothetical protein